MFRGTNRQVSLLDPGGALPPAARARLSRSWGVSFHEEVFPLLLGVEGSFSGLYAEQGRPNWSVARILGVILSSAARVGKVIIDHGDTACKTPDAIESIQKAWAHSSAKGFTSPAAHERSRESLRPRC